MNEAQLCRSVCRSERDEVFYSISSSKVVNVLENCDNPKRQCKENYMSFASQVKQECYLFTRLSPSDYNQNYVAQNQSSLVKFESSRPKCKVFASGQDYEEKVDLSKGY